MKVCPPMGGRRVAACVVLASLALTLGTLRVGAAPASASPTANAQVRFEAVDVFVDSGPIGLAASPPGR